MMFMLPVDADIILRLPDESDTPELFTLFEENRAHLTEWQDWPDRIKTEEDCREFILRHEREYGDGKSIECLIVYQEKPVGMCSLSKIVAPLRKAEIGYWVAEDYQGKRIVSRSCRGLMKYVFETMNINRLALKFKRVNDEHENFRSRRVAERLGFTEEGILRQDGMTKGVLMDMVMTSLLAEEWRAIQNA